eukprot:2211888-Amphidinium_carterae.1
MAWLVLEMNGVATWPFQAGAKAEEVEAIGGLCDTARAMSKLLVLRVAGQQLRSALEELRKVRQLAIRSFDCLCPTWFQKWWLQQRAGFKCTGHVGLLVDPISSLRSF